jgi:hypothetical protein
MLNAFPRLSLNSSKTSLHQRHKLSCSSACAASNLAREEQASRFPLSAPLALVLPVRPLSSRRSAQHLLFAVNIAREEQTSACCSAQSDSHPAHSDSPNSQPSRATANLAREEQASARRSGPRSCGDLCTYPNLYFVF